MWNPPTKRQLEKIPKLYAQDGVKDKKIYMKLFMGANTWYVAEIDHNNWDTMFCYMVNERTKQGSWGYSSLRELANTRVGYVQVDRDLYEVTPYSPKRLSQIKR